ncbi:aldo/keto reductase [Nocardiopsis salina]|uniref:aldo/keto reductase n=1 Tax=Nocardiopsis salina TaxID=245836 RepID=UPI000347BB4A|nr:aldo/keto reductase [Nocardiopsis salina]
MTLLGMGTYRSRDAATSAGIAASAGCALIDTAPVYGHGAHQAALAPVLRTHPNVKVATKVGYLTRGQAQVALTAGALTDEEAAFGHSIAPAYVRHQIAMSRIELRRFTPDIVYLHNPEHQEERSDLHARIRAAFAALEDEAARGMIRGYGVATWTGFDCGAFTVSDLVRLAREAAGSTQTALTAIQLPVSMVNVAPIRQSLNGCGPLHEANEAGLQSWASAPLHGGELPSLIRPKLADIVRPGASGVDAALLMTASAPGLTGLLISTTNAGHWKQAAEAVRDLLPDHRLKELCELLDPEPT